MTWRVKLPILVHCKLARSVESLTVCRRPAQKNKVAQPIALGSLGEESSCEVTGMCRMAVLETRGCGRHRLILYSISGFGRSLAITLRMFVALPRTR
jgi:hypothetical protein